jgi:hypothetical protein
MTRHIWYCSGERLRKLKAEQRRRDEAIAKEKLRRLENKKRY